MNNIRTKELYSSPNGDRCTYAETDRADCSLPVRPIYPQVDKSPALNWRTSSRVDTGLSSNHCSSLSERSWTRPQASLLAVKAIQLFR
jgi:hypothetical protein